MGHEDVLNMLKFGAITENTCDFQLSQLVKWDPTELPQTANSFFEMFIMDKDGSMIDVPVLVKNLLDANGNLPNEGSESQMDQWRLVRRFFIYDTVSGIVQANGFMISSFPSGARVASSLKLNTTLDPYNKGRSFVPFLEVEYREKETKKNQKNTDTQDSNKKINY